MERGGGLRGEKKRKISAEEVLTKIKDDGDFDRLRLNIIRQLKADVELRNNMISMVRQSAALNRPGAETMQPRQLSDAIHQEIGDKVMSQISDGLWKIIRSPDGMKAEITETVQLVYNQLAHPTINVSGESSSRINSVPIPQGHHNNGCVEPSTSDGRLSDGEPNGPPGFSLHEHRDGKGHRDYHHEQMQRMSASHFSNTGAEDTNGMPCNMDRLEPNSVHHIESKACPEPLQHNLADDDGDDDPDLPPGFG